MKKIFCKVLSAMLGAVMLAGCAGEAPSEVTTTTAKAAQNAEATATEAADVTGGADGGESAEVVPEESGTEPNPETEAKESGTMRDITAWELVSELKIGWNLGNTLDATGTGLASETVWGNPLTKYEMFTVVKDMGFNAVRIPTTWYNHTDADGTIDPEWMARVREVVDYAYDQGLYVILNSHHEEWLFPSYEKEDELVERVYGMWVQIATAFEGYSERLIFEGLNEPRMKGTALEWTGGDEEGWAVVNSLNKAFVEAVRSTGGNNALRCLMVTPYAASSEAKAYQALVLPEDGDKLIVSIHGYIPYTMALSDTGSGTFVSVRDGRYTRDIDNTLKGLDETFLQNGIPVILGETGARNKDNTEDRVLWADYYFGSAAEYGIPCFWWDNGAVAGGGELFGILNRRELEWFYPEIAEAAVSAAEAGRPLLAEDRE